ncbi:MAG: hypothetical protein ACU0A5_14150 [Salipiger marinus]|uniref:hypothetical protein n=1 Tax=Salipiger marinus TaxID=555512 RepID=UPI00405A13F1
MVQDTLNLLNKWFTEETAPERPKLISKLALLELCGWLENWMDDFIKELSHDQNCAIEFIDASVIKPNHGFNYKENFRTMIAKIMGEYCVTIVERRFEAAYPGDLERLKNYLGQLKRLRNDFAHNQYNSVIITQAHFQAPSILVTNFYQNLAQILANFRLVALQVRGELIGE